MVWSANSGLQAVCSFRLLSVSNLCEHQTEAVFDLKLMVGWVWHKVVLDKSVFKLYNIGSAMDLISRPLVYRRKI